MAAESESVVRSEPPSGGSAQLSVEIRPKGGGVDHPVLALELNQDGVGRSVADVDASVTLCGKPHSAIRLQLYVDLVVARHQAPTKIGQGHHDGVGMIVRSGCFAGLIKIVQYSLALLFPEHSVVVGVGRNGVVVRHCMILGGTSAGDLGRQAQCPKGRS